MRNLIFLLLLSFVGLFASAELSADELRSQIEESLKNLTPHPRLLLTDARLKTLKESAKADQILARYAANVVQRADDCLKADDLVYAKTNGLNLLLVAREAKYRIMTLAFAYRWTHDSKYKDGATRVMDTVCKFKDWFPGHYLDCAEMGFAVMVGYDWLYAELTPEQRAFYLDNVHRCVFGPKYDSYFKRVNLWGAVCNGSFAAIALGFAEDSPAFARDILLKAIPGMKGAVKGFEPDGVWAESAYYWNVVSENFIYGTASLQSAVGKDFGWTAIPGISKAGWAAAHCIAPSRYPARYADIPYYRLNAPDAPLPPDCWHLFWYGTQFKQQPWINLEHYVLRNKPAHVMHVVLYSPERKVNPPPKAARFGGKAELAIFRTDWFQPNAAWLCVKSGANNASHGHIDAGNFEYEINGVRWVYDIGQDDYGLKGYFGKERPTYFRTGPKSHNTLVIDSQHQAPSGKGRIAAFSESDNTVTVDLKDAYGIKELRHYSRYFMLKKRMLEVSDRLNLAKDAPIEWGFATDAEIEILSNGKARLTMKGQKLLVSILDPDGQKFQVKSCDAPAPEASNEGFQRLFFEINAKKDQDMILRVRFEPEVEPPVIPK